MSEPRRITSQLVAVLRVFAADPDKDLTVNRIAQTIRRSKPTVAGILSRVEDAGWLTATWQEKPSPARPVRVYRLSATGAQRAQEILGTNPERSRR